MEQFLTVQSTIYLVLSGALLTTIMLLAGQNVKLVRVMIAELAAVDPLFWALILWTVGGGDVVEGAQACFVRGEWTTELKTMFAGSTVTCSIKVAYLLGLFGKDRVTDDSGKTKGI